MVFKDILNWQFTVSSTKHNVILILLVVLSVSIFHPLDKQYDVYTLHKKSKMFYILLKETWYVQDDKKMNLDHSRIHKPFLKIAVLILHKKMLSWHKDLTKPKKKH